MLHCIFYQRLDAEQRQLEGGRLNVIFDIQLLAETKLLDIDVFLQVFQLDLEGYRFLLLQGVHVPSEIIRKGYGGLLCNVRIDGAHHGDGGQCIVHEMRLNLADHDAYLSLVKLLLGPFLLAGKSDVLLGIMIDLRHHPGDVIRKQTEFISVFDLRCA